MEKYFLFFVHINELFMNNHIVFTLIFLLNYILR